MPLSEGSLDSILGAIITHALIGKGIVYDPPEAIVDAAKAVAVEILEQYGPPTPPSGTAAFIQEDDTTQGSWKGVYGTLGHGINSDSLIFPPEVQALFTGSQNFIWENDSSDVRALQKEVGSLRIASAWYAADLFTIELIFSDALLHKVALYALDWDGFGPRIITVGISDSNGNTLDTRSLSQFQAGKYLQWNVSGHLILKVTSQMPGSNATLSGIFFD
jgi:hypothetical protein